MELSELLPQKVGFKLSQLDRELYLNMMTLDDAVWVQENFPGDKLKESFEQLKLRDVFKIIARLLDIPSKKYLASIEFEIEDKDGNIVPCKKMSVAEKLMKLTIDGEVGLIMSAFAETKKRSNDLAKEINEQLGDQKKTIHPTGV